MPPSPAPSHAFDDLVEESLDEAAFLWRRWESELGSLTRNLDEVWSWTEDRLHGALDGVRAAGPRLVEVGSAAMASGDPDRIAVGAALLGSSADSAATAALVTALGATEGPALRAIVRGLELLGTPPALRAAATALGERGTPATSAALCRLKTFHRSPPGRELAAAFESDDVDVRVDAIRAATCLPAPAADEWIARGLAATDPVVRQAAAEAGATRGIQAAWRAATRSAAVLDADAAPYLRLLALLGSSSEHDVIYAALRVPALQRQAVWALGHVGTVKAAETCLTGMKHEPLARECGEAYAWITGADLARDGLARNESVPEVPAFEDDDLDANLVPPPEALWPLPDVDAVRKDWETRRSEMHATARHIRGVAVSRATLLAAVETGPMLRRPDLVLELRARTKGRYDVETRAFAARQRKMMAAARAAISSDGGA
jgi:uncharacterized protein (TIGR02270 family)